MRPPKVVNQYFPCLFHFDDKDLIYEGIATVLQSAIFAQAVWDDKDLIYEGIATSDCWCFFGSFGGADDKDLIYEGIATLTVTSVLR